MGGDHNDEVVGVRGEHNEEVVWGDGTIMMRWLGGRGQ